MYNGIIVTHNDFKSLNPTDFGYEDCAPSHSFGPAVRTYWLIHFIVSGKGIYKIKNHEYEISAGEMFVIPPYVETYYEADPLTPWKYIWIGFTTEKLPVQLADTVKCPEAANIFYDMKRCVDFSDGKSAYLCARIWDLFALLANRHTKEKDYISTALDYIHSKYMHPITVEDISRYLNLDRTYFSVIFKKSTGLSPKQYLLKHRMNMAASLLADSSISISVVAASVGYSDIYTFSKMFKKCFGQTPTEYKKRL